MRKRLFSPQRYLQRRNEVIIPSEKTQGRREWVISRGLCHYRLFVLQDIPVARRESVLQIKIQQWSPFQDYASYQVWQGAQVQVWLWDNQKQHSMLTETGLKKAAMVLPETVLHTRPMTEEIQIIQCLEGFEGQIWQQGLLTGSRWWSQVPTLNEWNYFQRTHGLPATHTVPSVIEPPLLDRPWGRTRRHLDRLGLYQERVWIVLGTVLFIISMSWQATAIWKWQQATEQLHQQIDELNDSIAPILTARTQAINEKRAYEKLLTLNPYPSQLELITQIAEQLPRQNTRLIEWVYQAGELRFTIETNTLDPTFYVKTFQALPLFKDVKAETGRQSNRIIVSMRLNEGQPPGIAPTSPNDL